ncbi:MAG: ABC transporter permease [Anaerolineae bacterium]|nr:ABC transporter permease [Anaerolineae bacterium]
METPITPPRSTSHHTHIQPASGWLNLNARELWAYRDLFWILMLRDVKVRYKQTLLGVVWVILQPLTAALIFAVIFGRFADLPSGDTPYMLYVFIAMLPWNIFSGALQRAGTSLISDSRLISKVYFPRIVIPIASSSAVLIDFCVAFIVGLFLMTGYGVYPTWRWLILPLCLILVLILTLGVALFFSALNVYYRDFMYALPFIIQVWMYASPIAYSTEIVPDSVRSFYALNPMAGIIDGFRWSLLGLDKFPTTSVGISVILTFVAFSVGLLVFQRIEDNFADVI